MRISVSQYNYFVACMGTKPKAYRLGQHFCNTYGIVDQELFYLENTKQALDLIWEKYVQHD